MPYLGACQTEQLNRPPNFDPAMTYHLAPTPSQPVKAAVPYICGQLGKRVFLLLPDYAFGHEQEVAYINAIAEQPGCSVVGKAYFPLGTSDYNPYIPTILGSGADALVFGGVGRDTVSFLRQAKQFGVTDRLRTFLRCRICPSTRSWASSPRRHVWRGRVLLDRRQPGDEAVCRGLPRGSAGRRAVTASTPTTR